MEFPSNYDDSFTAHAGIHELKIEYILHEFVSLKDNDKQMSEEESRPVILQ